MNGVWILEDWRYRYRLKIRRLEMLIGIEARGLRASCGREDYTTEVLGS